MAENQKFNELCQAAIGDVQFAIEFQGPQAFREKVSDLVPPDGLSGASHAHFGEVGPIL